VGQQKLEISNQKRLFRGQFLKMSAGLSKSSVVNNAPLFE
jgi:hypothetical protein